MKNDNRFTGVAVFPVRKIHLVQCGHALCMPVSKWLNTRRMEGRLSRIPSDQGSYFKNPQVEETMGLSFISICSEKSWDYLDQYVLKKIY